METRVGQPNNYKQKNILNAQSGSISDNFNDGDLLTVQDSELVSAVGNTTTITNLSVGSLVGNITSNVALEAPNVTTPNSVSVTSLFATSPVVTSLVPTTATISSITASSTAATTINGDVTLGDDITSTTSISAPTITSTTITATNLTNASSAVFAQPSQFEGIAEFTNIVIPATSPTNYTSYQYYTAEGTASVPANTWTDITFSTEAGPGDVMQISGGALTVLRSVTSGYVDIDIQVDWDEADSGKRWITAFTGASINSGNWGTGATISEYANGSKWSALTSERATATRTTQHFVRRQFTVGDQFHVAVRHNRTGVTYTPSCLIQVSVYDIL